MQSLGCKAPPSMEEGRRDCISRAFKCYPNVRWSLRPGPWPGAIGAEAVTVTRDGHGHGDDTEAAVTVIPVVTVPG